MDVPHPENENLVSRLLDEALRINNPADREAYLRQASAGDESLLKEVESLLAFAEGLEEFCEQPQDLVGQVVGKYKIQDVIGRGGMGTVYRATRTQDYAKTVAIKVINRHMISEAGIRRFGKEMRIMAQFNHANLARLIDGGTIGDDLPYVVMEYIEGQSIDVYCDSNKLTIRERLLLFVKVCAVVSFIHKGEIVHRDIKPGNILVTAQGEPKLIDFGIAKVLNPTYDAEQFSLTKHLQVPCSPEYCSPEQIRGDPGIGKSSDVYSLGAVFYEILTGHRPHRFQQNTQEEIRRVICEGEILRPSEVIFEATKKDNEEASERGSRLKFISMARACQPQQLRRQLAGSLDSVMLKALCKDPRHRYESVDAFAADLENHLNGRSVRAGKKDWWREFRNLIGKIGDNLPPVNVSMKPKLAVYFLLMVALLIWKFVPRVDPNVSDLPGGVARETTNRLLTVRPDSLGATLSAAEQQKLQSAIRELSDNLGAFLVDERVTNDSWELSQIIVSSTDVANFNRGNLHNKLHTPIAPNPYSKWLEQIHLGASDWTILALLKLGVADPRDLDKRIDFIVSQQHEGWWPMYPSDPDSADSPSTYATAYSMLALHEYLKSRTAPADPQKLRDAIRRGQEWLIATREANKTSWKDGPFNPGGKSSDGLSALVLHVLHKTGANPEELRQIENYWRQHLPTPESDPSQRYKSEVYAKGSGKVIETTNHIAMPWGIIAASDTYAGGTDAEKKETVAWIKKVVDNIDKNRINPDQTILKSAWYIKAELLISLRYVIGDEVL